MEANNPKTVRELARDLVAAQDAYCAVYRATCDSKMDPEARIDALLELDRLQAELGDARRALTAAQDAAKVAA